jgi:chromosome segregation ATPase
VGTISAADVRSLVSERQELRAEVQRLGDENQKLHAKQSNSAELINLLENRVRDLAPFREGHDTLTETVKLQDAELGAVRAARDDLSRKLSAKNDELVAARYELVQLTQQKEDSRASCENPGGAAPFSAPGCGRRRVGHYRAGVRHDRLGLR